METAKGDHFRGAEEGARSPGRLAKPRTLPGCLSVQRASSAPPARPPFPFSVTGRCDPSPQLSETLAAAQ